MWHGLIFTLLPWGGRGLEGIFSTIYIPLQTVVCRRKKRRPWRMTWTSTSCGAARRRSRWKLHMRAIVQEHNNGIYIQKKERALWWAGRSQCQLPNVPFTLNRFANLINNYVTVIGKVNCRFSYFYMCESLKGNFKKDIRIFLSCPQGSRSSKFCKK